MSHCMTKQLARETKKPFFDLAATLYQSTGVSCIITENSAEGGPKQCNRQDEQPRLQQTLPRQWFTWDLL